MRLVVAFALFALPLSASAGPSPQAYRPPPPSGVAITGDATVRDARVVVRCEALVFVDTLATCRVDASFVVSTATGATLAPAADSPDDVRFDGAAAAPRSLSPGASLRVTVAATRRLATSPRFRGGPWVLSPAAVRHPFLGESTDIEHSGDDASVPLYVGAHVTLDGVIALDAGDEPAVRVSVDAANTLVDPRSGREVGRVDDEEGPRATVHYATVGMSVSARRTEPGLLRNGGPVLAFGMRGPLDAQGSRGVFRVGWEVSFEEYVFAQAAVEMDGESLFESLVVDVATPEVAIMIPSLRVGVGVVARQLGPRPADLALRLRVGASLLPAGFDADFDYWPAVSGWTFSFTGRLSP